MPAPSISGVLETILYFTDEAATLTFYRDTLGMRLMGHTAGRNLFFRAGASVFLLFNAEATRQGNALPPHGATGPGHTCFQVDTAAYDPWKRHLEEHGVEILQKVEWGAGPNTPFRPGRSFYFSDPSGNLLEIANADFWPE